MATYYVAKTGSDAAAGTLAAPWLTIQKAINTATTPGDYVWIRAGTYVEHLAIGTAGTAGNYIHFMAYKGEKVIVDGGSTYALRDTGGHPYIYLQGIEFRSTDTVEYGLGLDTYPTGGSNYWVISGCRFSGKVYLIGNNITFSGNTVDGGGTFDNAVRDLLTVSHHNKYIGNTVRNYTIRALWTTNLTHDNTYYSNECIKTFNGIDCDGYGTVEYLHVLKRNYIEGATEVGIQMENCFACTVENNILVNCLAGIEWILYGPTNGEIGDTVFVASDGGYGSADNNAEGDDSLSTIKQNLITGSTNGIISYQAGGLQIINNTIEGTTRGIWLNSNSPTQLIRNNAFTDKGIICSSFTHIATDSNNGFAANPAYDNGTPTTLASYQSSTSKGTGSVVGSLSLTNFIPSTSSILVNAGTATGAPAKDIRGVTRPQGASVDIGAYEVA